MDVWLCFFQGILSHFFLVKCCVWGRVYRRPKLMWGRPNNLNYEGLPTLGYGVGIFFPESLRKSSKDFQQRWDTIGCWFEIISVKNVWREKQTDPGERQRPDGDDSIATQWEKISLLIQGYMHGGNRLFMVWTLITCGGIWQGLELDNKMDGATIVKYNKSGRFGSLRWGDWIFYLKTCFMVLIIVAVWIF